MRACTHTSLQEDNEWNMNFATPLTSPPRQLDNSFSETPLNKRQRLFSPQSSEEEDSFRPSRLVTSLFSPASTGSPESNQDSDDSLLKGTNDVMVVSPPRLERLQLFDYPRTPLSIARSSGVRMNTPSKSMQRPHTPGKSMQRPTKSLFK